VTLAAYAIPVSLAYAELAGLPPQVGIYGYLLGGLGYALLGSSRQLVVAPTSAISLMIAATVSQMADGNSARYAEIASLTAFTVAILCLIGWLFRLSILARLISDSILVGFKAGAARTIIMTRLPSFFGVVSGGHDFFERAIQLIGRLGETKLYRSRYRGRRDICAVVGSTAAAGKPVALGVVAIAIIAASALGLPSWSVPITGLVPAGLPSLAGPGLRLRDVEGIFPLAACCLLLCLHRKRISSAHVRGHASLQRGHASRIPRPRRCQSRGGIPRVTRSPAACRNPR
jgi:sulfate permease, SulP family